MGPKFSPTLKQTRESLDEFELLVGTVADPFMGELNYVAKGFFGLLLLHMISPALRIDFRALMTLSGITREGIIIDREGHRLDDDPDQPNRKTLRNVLERLDYAGLLTKEPVTYGDLQLVPDSSRILEHVPGEGIVCWAGAHIYVRRKPVGNISSVYSFKIPQIQTVNWSEMITSLHPDQTRVELCTRELGLSCNFLNILFDRNKVTDPAALAKLEQLCTGSGEAVWMRGLILFLASIERPHEKVAKKLAAILPAIQHQLQL
jgi:hypothetical protein